MTGTTGQKISLRMISMFGLTPVNTVGKYQLPPSTGAVDGRCPPGATSALAPRASSTKRSTYSSSAALIFGPTSVSSEYGSPGAFDERFKQTVVDILVHECALVADSDLPAVHETRSQRNPHGEN